MGGKTAQQHALEGHVSGQCNKPLSRPAHSLSVDDVLKELHSSPSQGLAGAEAAERLAEYGPNQLKEKKGVQPIAIFLEQIFNAMTLVSPEQTRGERGEMPSMTNFVLMGRFSFLPWLLVSAFRPGSPAAS